VNDDDVQLLRFAQTPDDAVAIITRESAAAVVEA